MDSTAISWHSNPANIGFNTAATEIMDLHNEIENSLRTSIEKALRIGELLTALKARMPHGEFGGWCSVNLPFADRTARRYMRLFRERDRLKTDTLSDLSDAYRLLSSKPAVPTIDDGTGVIGDLVIPNLHSGDIGEHLPEDWEPGAGESRLGLLRDGRSVFIESMPDAQYLRTVIFVGVGIVYTRRGINRHFLRAHLDRSHDIDPLTVEWCDPLPATADNNPFVSYLSEWKYEAAVSA